MRLSQHGVVIAVLAIGCSTATPTAMPTGTESATSPSPSAAASGALPDPGLPTQPPGGEPTGPSSADLIRDAHQRGAISDEDAAVYRVFAALGDDRLPAEFQSDSAGWEDHLATRDAAGLWDSLSAEQREAIAPYFIPPIYAGSWADPAAEADARPAAMVGFGQAATTVTAAVDPKNCASEQLRGQFYVNVPAAGGKVRIWWRNGVETSARAGTVASMLAAEVDTNIWPKLTALMGREPLSDANVQCFNGEDGALDIYITDRTLPGYAEALTLAYPGACTGTPAFIIFDQPRDGRDYGTMDPAKLHAWEYAHEIFHAIQFAYTYGGPCGGFDEMDEATAMWAAEHVYHSEQFEWDRGWGSWFVWNHDSLFSNENAGGGYGSWPFFASLTHRHGPERIRALYETAEQVSGPYDAIEITVPEGIDGFWPQFVRDLWDDHEEHNIWPEWDPGAWADSTYDGSAWVNLPRPGGGGLITHTPTWDQFKPARWRIAPWAADACARPKVDVWSDFDSSVGQWECPLKDGEEPPAEATYDLSVYVSPLARQEHEIWLPDEEWPRYIKIDRPGLGIEDEHLSVQGFFQLADGSWTGPVDWKTEDEVEFCRDDAAENVQRVVMLYGNSEVLSFNIDGSYNVEVRSACPVTVSGTLTNSNVVAIRAPDGQTDSVHTTTMDMTLEPRENEPTAFDAVGGSWRMEYTMDSWEDNTYNAGADGCILTETATGSFAGSWDETSSAEFSYDPVSLWGSLGFSITPTGDYTTTANCPGIFGPTTTTVDASQYLVAIGVYSVQGRREGDRIVFEFDEERVSGESSQGFTTTLSGTLVTRAD